jgi:hypothetical protein
MKLIKRVQQLEQSERVEQAAAAGIAIAWSTDEQRAADLADEEVAMDIHILSNDLGVDQWRTVERRRRDADDLGDVFDAAGLRIGRVTERDGSLVRWVEVEG